MFFVFLQLTTASTTKELSAYAKAGAIASEALSCIKTVIVFGGQEKECQRLALIHRTVLKFLAIKLLTLSG
jgi:hypothetical protein